MSDPAPAAPKDGGGKKEESGVAKAWGIGILVVVLLYTGVFDGVLRFFQGAFFTVDMYKTTILLFVAAGLLYKGFTSK